jgi:hypothetical protein
MVCNDKQVASGANIRALRKWRGEKHGAENGGSPMYSYRRMNTFEEK